MKRHTRIMRYLVLFMLIIGTGRNDAASADSKFKVSTVAVSIRFFCMWWSDETLERLDPNHPPSYDEYTEIQEWSVSDPGWPNPEAIDILVEVKNLEDKPIEGLYVDLFYEWKVGPIGEAKESRWEDPQPLDDEIIHYLPAGASREIKISPFLVWEKQRSLAPRSWAWALKVIVKARRIERVKKLDAEQKVELTVERILPIIPGD